MEDYIEAHKFSNNHMEQLKKDKICGCPFNIEDGSSKNPAPAGENLIYNLLKELLEKDPKSVILNAATPMGLGFFGEEREELERIGRFVDVGIAEENAVAMASGIDKSFPTAFDPEEILDSCGMSVAKLIKTVREHI